MNLLELACNPSVVIDESVVTKDECISSMEEVFKQLIPQRGIIMINALDTIFYKFCKALSKILGDEVSYEFDRAVLRVFTHSSEILKVEV